MKLKNFPFDQNKKLHVFQNFFEQIIQIRHVTVIDLAVFHPIV